MTLLATVNLREGLLDDLFVEDTLPDVLQKLLDPHVAWLKDTGAASRNEENDDLRMIVFHPVAELLRSMNRPRVDEPNELLVLRKPLLLDDVLTVCTNLLVHELMHGLVN